MTPELSAALASALEREANLHMDGCTVKGIGQRHLELSLELGHVVIVLRDPATIPALVSFPTWRRGLGLRMPPGLMSLVHCLR